MNKKGDEQISIQTVIGVVVGGILLSILLIAAWPYVKGIWDLVGGTEFDEQTTNSLERLAITANSLKAHESKVIPVQISEDAMIVSFDKNADKLNANFICNGEEVTNKEITKPCDDACLCLCSVKDSKIDECLEKDCTIINYEITGDCDGHVILTNSFEGKKGLYNVKLSKEENLVKIEGVSRFGTKIQPITFYYILKAPTTQYPPQVFTLVEEFFKEEVGLKINFQFYKEDNTLILDHKTKFAIIEDIYSPSREEAIQFLTKLGFTSQHPDWKKLIEAYPQTLAGGGRTVLLESTIYLWQSTQILVSEDEEYIKNKAFVVVHEILHLAGLWHTNTFDGDETLVPYKSPDGIENIMVGIPTSTEQEGKYGWFITEFQKNKIKDYFSGGKTFEQMKNSNFDLDVYFDVVAQENGWKK